MSNQRVAGFMCTTKKATNKKQTHLMAHILWHVE